MSKSFRRERSDFDDDYAYSEGHRNLRDRIKTARRNDHDARASRAHRRGDYSELEKKVEE